MAQTEQGEINYDVPFTKWFSNKQQAIKKENNNILFYTSCSVLCWNKQYIPLKKIEKNKMPASY